MAPLICLIAFIILHFSICTLFFVLIQRTMFIAYNHGLNTESLSAKEILRIQGHGLYTDIKIALYITAFPLLMLGFYVYFPTDVFLKWMYVYDVIISIVVSLVCVADTVLYRCWQYKIEASVLQYLRSLKGAFASVSTGFVFVAFGVVVFISVIFSSFLILTDSLFLPSADVMVFDEWIYYLVPVVILVLAAVFFLVIRGWHIRPDTPVYSYYSNNQFYNHSAVNPVYNFIYSLSVNEDFGKQFQEFSPDYCKEKITLLFPNGGKPQIQLLNTDRPNILFIVWESLCAQFMECLGGRHGVMPNFDRLSEEGVLFTNCWSASFRTDRGLVCILSGYMGMPTVSAIQHTNKLPNLPALPRLLRDKEGYKTMAVHGGQLNIFHKSDYYWTSGHDTLVEERHFPTDAPRGKWGVHDGFVFNWLADYIINQTDGGNRWFKTYQTLSTHEPFQVPYSRFKENKVDNTYAYADDAFGKFIEKLKASSAWNNLLIVVTGDHGLDFYCAPDKDRNTHIPLLLLGGAVKQPLKINTLMNQTDIAATLLGQMGLPHDDFLFSRDVTADSYAYPFAFHTFNNGFIFRDATGVTFYDNNAQQATNGHDILREETAKIIMQTVYSDFDKR